MADQNTGTQQQGGQQSGEQQNTGSQQPNQAQHVDTPIDLYISRRGEDRTRLKLLFMNANHTDPEIGSFAADGPCKDAYMVKTSKSHWILYVKKKNVWDSASIDNFLVNKHMGRWIEFNFIASFSANLPSGAVKAT